jgi:hypothetical protein
MFSVDDRGMRTTKIPREVYDSVSPKVVEGFIFRVFFVEDNLDSCMVIGRTLREAMDLVEMLHPEAHVHSIHEQDHSFDLQHKRKPETIYFLPSSVK